MKPHPPQDANEEKEFVIVSEKCTKTALAGLVGVYVIPVSLISIGQKTDRMYDRDAASLAGAAFSGRWEFTTKRGALLVMYRPRLSHIPRDVILKELMKTDTFNFKEKDKEWKKERVLITQVYKCPAYGLYLSTGGTLSSISLWN
jgi:hypothetical protein